MKNLAIYDPYLDTWGGGERYVLSIIQYALKQGHHVDLLWHETASDIISRAQSRFGLDLTGLSVISDELFRPPAATKSISRRSSLFSRLRQLKSRLDLSKQYDLFFFVSDGSLPLILSGQNIIHFQVPFKFTHTPVQKLSIFLKYLLCHYQFIVNSKFTSHLIRQSFSHPTTVIYPPVDTAAFTASASHPSGFQIINVGRFGNLLNSKNQHLLIPSFIKLYKQNPALQDKLRLVLVGASPSANSSYLTKLHLLAQGYPVDIIVNPDFTEVIAQYHQSFLYWHAAGITVDNTTNPESTEHFGITLVEALASSLPVIAPNRGGIPEIIIDNHNGFLIEDLADLVAKTQLLVSNPARYEKLKSQTVSSSGQFNLSSFNQQLSQHLSL